MSGFIKLALLAILLILITPESAAICKWVDEDGIVHYAENCPEDSDSSEVRIKAPPSQEQIDASTERSERLKSVVSTRKAQESLEKNQASAKMQNLEKTTDNMIRTCAEARWNLGILQKQLPVYYDEENQLHYKRSLHDYWYEGQRTYLDDQQRETEIRHYTQVEQQTCTESESGSRERIRIYMEKRDNEICRHLEQKLANMKKFSTGIPSSEMRELEQTIDTNCR